MAKRYAPSCSLLANLVSQVISTLPLAFIRRRKIGPRVAFAALLHLCAPSARTTLAATVMRLFLADGKRLNWATEPDPSNLSRNLHQLNPLLDAVVAQIRRLAGMIGRIEPMRMFFRGRLIAVDGSWMALPSSGPLHARYGTHRNGNAGMRGKATYRPQALMVVLYDVVAGVPIAHELLPFNGGERNGLRLLLPHLKRGDTLLMDRGYMSKEILAQLQDAGVHFILRAPTGKNGWSEARQFEKRKCRAQRVTFDQGLTLRLVRATRPRSRLRKGSGTIEEVVLATDLKLPIDAIRRLYAARWRIEGFFGDLKNLQSIEDLHGRDAGALEREVVAHFMWFTLAALADNMMAAADRRTGNFTRANRRVVFVIIACIIDAIISRRSTPAVVDQAMAHLAGRRPRSRPGRSFPRNAKTAQSKWYRAKKGGGKTRA